MMRKLIASATSVAHELADITVNTASGQVRLMSNVVSDYNLNENWAMRLQGDEGCIKAILRWDELGRLGERLRYVEDKLAMVYAEPFAGAVLGTSGVVKLRVRSADRSVRGQYILELEVLSVERKKRPRLKGGASPLPSPNWEGVKRLNGQTI